MVGRLGEIDVTALIVFICLALGLAIMAGAFYFGYKVGIINKTADDNAIFLAQADKQVKEMSEAITQLEYQLEQEQGRVREKVAPISTGWNPGDPLSAGRR